MLNTVDNTNGESPAWDPSTNTSIAPTFEAAARNYIYSTLNSGDIICPFYRPDILPGPWAQNVNLFNQDQASYFYYWWISVGSNCQLANRVYFYLCLGNNGFGFGSSITCENYLGHYGNTMRGTPTAQSGKMTFYQQRFQINYRSSTSMTITGGTSNVNYFNFRDLE